MAQVAINLTYLLLSTFTFRKRNKHLELKGHVCLICFQKSDRNQISASHRDKIILNFPEFETFEDILPSGLCDTCRISLGRKAELDLSFLFQKHGEINQYLCDYSESCFCEVCEMAKCNVKKKLSLIRKGKVDRPRKNDPESPAKVIKRCSKCEAVVGAGLKHNCKSVKNFKIWELFCHPTWSFKLLVKWSKTTYSMAKVMS